MCVCVQIRAEETSAVDKLEDQEKAHALKAQLLQVSLGERESGSEESIHQVAVSRKRVEITAQ